MQLIVRVVCKNPVLTQYLLTGTKKQKKAIASRK